MSNQAPHASSIVNKQVRSAVYHDAKHQKAKLKRKRRKERKKLEEELGDKAPPKQKPRTLENTREKDETVVAADDEEVLGDEEIDEFADYFAGTPPKTLITTGGKDRPTKPMYRFMLQMLRAFPGSVYYARKNYQIKEIIEYARNREFTNVVVVTEHRKKPNGLWISHLPHGPTAHFKLTSVTMPENIKKHAAWSRHRPELLLNQFTTRLGRRVGRLLSALYRHDPEFQGRRVATFHNQRDFIFFRQHRYMFDDNGKRARLQEMGPRFTLKLKTLQKGTFDTTQGEYEWLHKKEMGTSRRRFFL